MRKPFDKVFHMKDNKPTQSIIYFIESYMSSEENPDREHDNNSDYYKLTDKIKNVYYLITEYEVENISPIDLKDRATIRRDGEIFDTMDDLVDSLYNHMKGEKKK